ncbi:hypothetical protein BWQ96_08441 [Gracilariopsis chorda]|uniref:Uncharacterized protein n=1 Tax=Gracilariopsis chorda TaxID=448386 RepID=A0A2V3IIE5_9FLOR|nr:hypothetical protein BWQ96_08441 [Gracilariopsis chorda]|eukprot:PXF41842.1 hypothetical protein BWQ96_08441 [Gracilariopsis chorda]
MQGSTGEKTKKKDTAMKTGMMQMKRMKVTED